jgi:hypothetical protein
LPGLTPGPCCARDTAAAWETKANATLPGFGPGPRCAIIARGPLTMDGQDVAGVRPRPSLRGPKGVGEAPCSVGKLSGSCPALVARIDGRCLLR